MTLTRHILPIGPRESPLLACDASLAFGTVHSSFVAILAEVSLEVTSAAETVEAHAQQRPATLPAARLNSREP